MADQRDSDSVLVVILLAGVGTLQLVAPPKCWFDVPVRHTLSVADHEVVPDSQPRFSTGCSLKMVGMD